MYSVLYFGLFYTTIKMKHAKFLGTSTLFVTKNHRICQPWHHLLLPTEQQTFVQPSVSISLSNLPLQFVSVWPIWSFPSRHPFFPVSPSVQLFLCDPSVVYFTRWAWQCSRVFWWCQGSLQSQGQKGGCAATQYIPVTPHSVYRTNKAALATLEPIHGHVMLSRSYSFILISCTYLHLKYRPPLFWVSVPLKNLPFYCFRWWVWIHVVAIRITPIFPLQIFKYLQGTPSFPFAGGGTGRKGQCQEPHSAQAGLGNETGLPNPIPHSCNSITLSP